MTPHNAVAAAGRKLVLATSATPLGRIWRSGYRAVGRLAAASIARRYDATVYVRSAGARGRIVPGLSDIDLVAIARAGATLPHPPVMRLLGGLVQADLYDSTWLRHSWGENVLTNIERRKLAVDRDVPVHGAIEPFAQMVATIKAKPGTVTATN